MEREVAGCWSELVESEGTMGNRNVGYPKLSRRRTTLFIAFHPGENNHKQNEICAGNLRPDQIYDSLMYNTMAALVR